MELENLEGKIIGVITNENQVEDFSNKKVNEIILFKVDDSLKMVGLPIDLKNKIYDDLSSRDKSKVLLASKLNNKCIILRDFSKGLIKKDIEIFKILFKKIASYDKKIILIDHNLELFINCVDKIYNIENDEIVYSTNNIFDKKLYSHIDMPQIVKFIFKCKEFGINLDEYNELDELIKAIYRIKS